MPVPRSPTCRQDTAGLADLAGKLDRAWIAAGRLIARYHGAGEGDEARMGGFDSEIDAGGVGSAVSDLAGHAGAAAEGGEVKVEGDAAALARDVAPGAERPGHQAAEG